MVQKLLHARRKLEVFLDADLAVNAFFFFSLESGFFRGEFPLEENIQDRLVRLAVDFLVEIFESQRDPTLGTVLEPRLDVERRVPEKRSVIVEYDPFAVFFHFLAYPFSNLGTCIV